MYYSNGMITLNWVNRSSNEGSSGFPVLLMLRFALEVTTSAYYSQHLITAETNAPL